MNHYLAPVKNLIICMFIVTMAACVQNAESSQKTGQNNFMDSIADRFIYKERIKVFNSDSINRFVYRYNSNKLIPVLNDLHYKIFQDPKNIDTVENEWTYYLYNIQDADPRNLKITLIGCDDDWINKIILLSYHDLVLKERHTMAESGGEFEIVESFSEMTNDSTYSKTTKLFDFDDVKQKEILKSQKQEEIKIRHW